MVAFRLAKSGYYGGDPEKVLKGRVDLVLGLVEYEGFSALYEEAYVELNRENN